MQTVIGRPPRADPGSSSPGKTPRGSCLWLAAIQQKCQQACRRCLASISGGPRPGPAGAYTMLVASDIRQDAYDVTSYIA
jgi:hypothetical protein